MKLMAVSLLELKLDLHVHSHYSVDSVITPRDLVSCAQRRGLDGVAITDHDRIDSGLRIAKGTDFFVIPGIEVTSRHGHIVGLGVNESIPRDLSADETVDKIHKAGGLAVACHPVSLVKGSLGNHITSKFDAVETINASALPFKYSVRRSQLFAARVGIDSCVAGSDAHYKPEIGYAYTSVKADLEVDKVLEAIRKGLCQPFGKAIPITTRIKRRLLVTAKKRVLEGNI